MLHHLVGHGVSCNAQQAVQPIVIVIVERGRWREDNCLFWDSRTLVTGKLLPVKTPRREDLGR